MPLRMAQVGLGDFGRRWMKIVNAHSAWEYVAIATRDKPVRDQCGEECGLATTRRFATLREALDSGVEADAVLVTTPHFRHKDDVVLALDRGIDVLVEKPLAGDLASCLDMREAARRSPSILMVGENYRFGDGAKKMREIIASGSIGTPEVVCLQYFVGHAFPDGDWRNDYEYPVLIENATHQFDLLRYITGTDPVSVFCSAFASTRTPHWSHPNVTALFEMNSGLRFQFSASWAYPEFRTPWEGEWRVHASKGSVRWLEDSIIVERDGARETVVLASQPSDRTLSGTLQEFTAAVEQGRKPSVDIEDNLQTLGMVFGAIQSSESKHPVAIGDLIR
jgi:predicted dehydrogenase